MELAVIILFVLSIAVVSALVGRIQKRRAADGGPAEAGTAGRKPAAGPARKPARQRPAPMESGTSPQAAKEAASLLSAGQHQQIYAALAQGQPVKALKLYSQFTGAGIRASGAAITNMAAHPQPYVRPIPEDQAGETAPSARNPTPSATPDQLQEEEISKWAEQLRPEDFLKP